VRTAPLTARNCSELRGKVTTTAPSSTEGSEARGAHKRSIHQGSSEANLATFLPGDRTEDFQRFCRLAIPQAGAQCARPDWLRSTRARPWHRYPARLAYQLAGLRTPEHLERSARDRCCPGFQRAAWLTARHRFAPPLCVAPVNARGAETAKDPFLFARRPQLAQPTLSVWPSRSRLVSARAGRGSCAGHGERRSAAGALAGALPMTNWIPVALNRWIRLRGSVPSPPIASAPIESGRSQAPSNLCGHPWRGPRAGGNGIQRAD